VEEEENESEKKKTPVG